jgi:hypothetical protein
MGNMDWFFDVLLSTGRTEIRSLVLFGHEIETVVKVSQALMGSQQKVKDRHCCQNGS